MPRIRNYLKMTKAIYTHESIFSDTILDRTLRFLRVFAVFKLLPKGSILITKWFNDNLLAINNNDPGMKNNLYFDFAEKEMILVEVFPKWLELLKENRSENPSLCFLDCGSNSGEYTVLAKSNPMYQLVYAFEPSSNAFRRLMYNIEINNFNKNIKLFKKAVGHSSGSSNLSLNLDLENHLVNINEDMNENSFEQVEVIRLDTLFEEISEYTIMLKLDVEGSELSVLKGAESIINSGCLALVIMEVNRSSEKNYGVSRLESCSLLLDHGYKMYEMTLKPGNIFLKCIKIKNIQYYEGNLVFISSRYGNESLSKSTSIEIPVDLRLAHASITSINLHIS